MAKVKHGDFMKNMQQQPKLQCAFLSNMRQVTIQNNLYVVIYMIQNYQIQFEIVIVGKMDCYWNFICLCFPSRKNKLIKSKELSKKFSPNLTRKFRNKIFCPLRTRAILDIMQTSTKTTNLITKKTIEITCK